MRIFCKENHRTNIQYRESMVGKPVWAFMDKQWVEAEIVAEKLATTVIFGPNTYEYLVRRAGKLTGISSNNVFPREASR